MSNTILKEVATFCMKMQIYPSQKQKNQLDTFFRALHVAYNITFHEVFQLNPDVCTSPNKDGKVWPDFKKMASAAWKDILTSKNPIVKEVPAAALTTNNGLFLLDAKTAWKTGLHNLPVDPNLRKEFRFYSAHKPRRSFLVQILAKNIQPSPDNPKVAWISIPKIGKVKARGFNSKLRFGEDGKYSYAEALLANELTNALSVRISKDTCDDYFASVTFSIGQKKDRHLYLQLPEPETPVPIGIDVGIKELAALSTGETIENKHFKREKKETLSRLNRKLSRMWGPANMAYRDYNHSLRQANRSLPDEEKQPLAVPGKKYLATQHKKALLERKIMRRRNTYYHRQSAILVRKSSMLAIETLAVKNMLRNHKLAFALSDVAMSDFLAKLKYKSERYGIDLRQVGTFEATSQLCSNCKAKNPALKNLAIRHWTCPVCGAQHNRDINAAKNILELAFSPSVFKEKPPNQSIENNSPPAKRKAEKSAVFIPGHPEIAVVFSKILTHRNNPRYVIVNKKTNIILDDAQGVGYKSAANARNCYKAKMRYSADSALTDQ